MHAHTKLYGIKLKSELWIISRSQSHYKRLTTKRKGDNSQYLSREAACLNMPGYVAHPYHVNEYETLFLDFTKYRTFYS